MSTPAGSGGNPFRAILDVSAALVSSLDLEEVFARVAEKIGEAMMVWSVDIQTYDRERDVLIYEAYWCQEGVGDEDRALIGHVTTVLERPEWRRLLDGGEVLEQHIDDPHLPRTEREALQSRGCRSCLAAPLVFGGEVIGALSVNETRFVRNFTSIERDLFAQLCGIASAAIHNARVHRRQLEQTRHLDALLNASRAITSSVVVEDVLQTVAEKAAQALGCPSCVIHELDRAADALVWRAIYPTEDFHQVEEREGRLYPLDDTPSDRAILERGEIVVESLSDPSIGDDSRASMEEWSEKTCVNVPLMFEGEPLGIMVLIETERERTFTEAEIDLVRALGEQAAVAIRNAHLYERQEAEARRVGSLLEAGQALTSSLDLKEVMALVADGVYRALGVGSVDIYEYRERDDSLVAVASVIPERPEEAATYVGTVLPFAEHPSFRRALERHAVVEYHIDDPGLPELDRGLYDDMVRWGEKSVIETGLFFADEVMGCLSLCTYDEVHRFTDEERELLIALAATAAMAIRNAHLYERQESEAEREAALRRAGQAITATVDSLEVMTRIAREAGVALGVDSTAVYDYEAIADTLTYLVLYEREPPPEPDEELGTAYPLADMPGERANLMAADVVVEDSSDPDLPEDRRRSMAEWDERTTVSAPLRAGDERLGILRFYCYGEERVFTERELELIRGLAEQASIAIHNARLYDDIQKQKQRVDTLLAAGKAITSTVDIDEVLARVTREACAALEVDSATVYEYDEATNRETYRAVFNSEPVGTDPDIDAWYSLDEFPGEEAIARGAEVVVQHLSDLSVPEDRRVSMAEWNEHTTMSVPLRVGERPLGILRFYVYGRERSFTEGEMSLARGLGEQAAVAIANSHLYERVNRMQRRTETLLRASRALTTSLKPTEVFDAITRSAGESLAAPRCGLYEYDKTARTLCARSFFEPEPTPGYDVLDIPEDIDRRPGDVAILEGGVVVVENVSDPDLDPTTRAEMEFWSEATVLNAPLVFRGEPLGILMVIFTGEERQATEDELALLSGLAEQAAAAMYNARLFDDIQKQKQRVDALLDTSRLLSSSIVLDEVMATLTKAAAEAFGSPRCDLYEYDKAADTMALRGYYEEVPTGLYWEENKPQPMDERPGDRAILESGEIVVESISDPDLDPATRTEMEEWGEKTCLNVPLIVKGEPLGILIISETECERRFTPGDLELARGLSDQVGIALQNARLYARLETQNRRLLNLLQSSRVMTGSMDVERAVETMCTEIAGLLECPVCQVDVSLRSGSGEFVPSEVLAADEEVAANVEPVLEPDETAERALAERQPVQADLGESGRRLVIPLLSQDEPSGFVELSGPLREQFGSDELEAVQILANQAAAAIDNARLLQERGRQAVTDGLTGLYNHRHFYERLTGEVARAKRYDTPVALVMLDVDDFKRFNDAFGHQAGDEALKEIGRLLLTSIRQHVDVPARYGGEEFAVILPNTGLVGGRATGERLTEHFAGGTVRTPESSPGIPVAETGVWPADGVPETHPDGALVVGERLRHSIEAAVLCREDGSPLRKVTVSVGVASFPAHAADPDGLVEAADKALYTAKRAGKNRVEAWRSEE